METITPRLQTGWNAAIPATSAAGSRVNEDRRIANSENPRPAPAGSRSGRNRRLTGCPVAQTCSVGPEGARYSFGFGRTISAPTVNTMLSRVVKS